MRYYTIRLDENKMAFIRNTMESQVEISSDVAWNAYTEYRKHGNNGDWEAFKQGAVDFYTANAINNMLKYADSEEENV